MGFPGHNVECKLLIDLNYFSSLHGVLFGLVIHHTPRLSKTHPRKNIVMDADKMLNNLPTDFASDGVPAP